MDDLEAHEAGDEQPQAGGRFVLAPVVEELRAATPGGEAAAPARAVGDDAAAAGALAWLREADGTACAPSFEVLSDRMARLERQDALRRRDAELGGDAEDLMRLVLQIVKDHAEPGQRASQLSTREERAQRLRAGEPRLSARAALASTNQPLAQRQAREATSAAAAAAAAAAEGRYGHGRGKQPMLEQPRWAEAELQPQRQLEAANEAAFERSYTSFAHHVHAFGEQAAAGDPHEDYERRVFARVMQEVLFDEEIARALKTRFCALLSRVRGSSPPGAAV